MNLAAKGINGEQFLKALNGGFSSGSRALEKLTPTFTHEGGQRISIEQPLPNGGRLSQMFDFGDHTLYGGLAELPRTEQGRGILKQVMVAQIPLFRVCRSP